MQICKKPLLIVLVAAVFLAGGYSMAKVADKMGSTHLLYDEKENIHRLNLCVGQRWSNEPSSPFKQIATRSDDTSIAVGSFLPTTEANSVDMAIDGKKVGVTTVHFDMEVVGIAPKTTSSFEVTVMADCGQSEAPPEPPKVETSEEKLAKWDWPYPTFKNNSYYMGNGPECMLENGERSDGYDIYRVGLIEQFDESYYIVQVGEDSPVEDNKREVSVFQTWLKWDEGKLGVRKVTSSNKAIATAKYFPSDGGFSFYSTKAGFAEIKMEFTIVPPGVDPKKVKKPVWKTMTFGVVVVPTKSNPLLPCTPGEQPQPQAEPVVEKCSLGASNDFPVPASPPAKQPKYTVASPTGLTPLEKDLARKLEALFKNKVLNPPAICTTAAVSRQAKKIARAFYKTKMRDDEFFTACVDCAQDVVNSIIDALADEEVLCYKVTKIGGWKNVIVSHTVAAVGPSCTAVNDDWIVLDTWFWAGNVPVLPKKYEIFRHRRRVNTLGKWPYHDRVDWGADRYEDNDRFAK